MLDGIATSASAAEASGIENSGGSLNGVRVDDARPASERHCEAARAAGTPCSSFGCGASEAAGDAVDELPCFFFFEGMASNRTLCAYESRFKRN